MITNKNEAKVMAEHILCHFKCKSNSTTCILNKNGTITDTSVIECDEIIIAMDIVSTKKTNTIETNVTSTSSINFHSKKS